MKKLIVILLAFPLAGCWNPFATVTNPITTSNLYEAELVFDGALKTFNELKSLCVSRALPPACRTYVKKAQAQIPAIYAADKSARAFVTNNPTLDPTSVVQALQNAVSTFQSTVSQLSAVKS